ncbi:MAG: ABC transporter permease [Armatimonadetes bacterium]|nr:ABC transporter permease [Armatimonadota bacterium]
MNLFCAALKAELVKVYSRPRNYVGFGLFFALATALALVFKYKPPWGELHRFLGGFSIVGNPFNALTMTRYMIAPTTYFFLPLITSVIAGDAFAGEFGLGTMRTILCRPVGRSRVFFAKCAVAMLHALLLTLFLGVSGIVIGGALLGFDSLVSWRNQLLIVGVREGLWRLAVAYSLVWIGVLPVVAMTLLFSTLTDNPSRAIVSAIGVLFITAILVQLPWFRSVKPYVFTTFADTWMMAVEAPIKWTRILRESGFAMAYVAFFVGAAWALFTARDMKC